MADREVTGTTKAPDGDILALCNPHEPSWSPRSKGDAIQDIEDSTHRYFVLGTDAQGDVKRISILVINAAGGKYLRSGPDPGIENNLRELPECLEMGPVVAQKPVRRNVAMVSEAERNKLRDAILALDKKKYQDLVSYWLKQDQIHQATHVHEGPAFLPWHRELVNRFEALLQEVDPTVALHYWDWQTDPRSSPDGLGGTTDLFTAEFMGSPGTPEVADPVGKPFDSDSGFVPPQITRQVAAGSPRNFELLDNKGQQQHLDIGSDEAMLSDQGNVAEQFKKMRSRLEYAHNSAHGYIGGTLRAQGHIAFQDPFVFLLHSNVDRLWASWQLRRVGDSRAISRRLDPGQVYGSEGNDPPYIWTYLEHEESEGCIPSVNAEMEPWAGNPQTPTKQYACADPPVEHLDTSRLLSPWGPPENQREVKTCKDPSVVRPPLYDNYVLDGPAGASWEAMLLGFKLPDGDIILATIAYNAVGPSTVEFVLESAPQITWWKGIDVPDGQGTSWMIETENSKKSANVSLWANQVHNGQALTFHKAKFFGGHNIVYRIGDLDRLPPGSRATFRWLQD
jgi:hypothetical protein